MALPMISMVLTTRRSMAERAAGWHRGMILVSTRRSSAWWGYVMLVLIQLQKCGDSSKPMTLETVAGIFTQSYAPALRAVAIHACNDQGALFRRYAAGASNGSCMFRYSFSIGNRCNSMGLDVFHSACQTSSPADI